MLFCNFTRGVDDLNGMQSVERSTVNDKRPSRCLVSSFAGDGEEKLSLSFLSFHLKNIFSSEINYRSLYLFSNTCMQSVHVVKEVERTAKIYFPRGQF